MTEYEDFKMIPEDQYTDAPTGVEDSVAVNQETISEPEDQSVDINEVAKEFTEEVSDKEYNFRALREELATMKEDRDRLRNDFEELRRNNVQRQPEPPRKRAIDDINSDDLITGA